MLVRELRSFIVIPDVTRFCVNPDGGSYSRPRDRFIVIPDVTKFESILTGSYAHPEQTVFSAGTPLTKGWAVQVALNRTLRALFR